MSGPLRNNIFIALGPLPLSITQYLTDIKGDLPDAKWTHPRNYHITLKFMGALRENAINQAVSVLSEIEHEPFDLKLNRLDHFGTDKYPRILWAGIEENEALFNLQQKIEEKLVSAGFQPNHHKIFRPHITLARLPKHTATQELLDLIENYPNVSSAPFRVDHFSLLITRYDHNEVKFYMPEAIFPLK